MAEAERPIGMSLPIPVLLGLAWLVPGLGHVLLGRRGRAAVFFVVVVAAFLLGVVFDGELSSPHAGDPLSYLATIASVGNGLLFFIARAVGLGQGVVTAAAYEFGNTFLLTAGMMNMLLILDTHDIVTGKKDW